MSARLGMQPPGEPLTPVDLLLRDQRQLTAVERFSRLHDDHALPKLEPHYRSLIPLNRPQAGEQYAFEVDLDSCSGCKACVTACHSLNGLDDNETWRDIGVLLGGPDRSPFQQTVTTACHHCVEPGCLEGCPVLAYEKDEATGIVRHLDDQCIGCQYCILKCPYEVPKYSNTRGIVRKCDMCHGRLAAGEAPACVQACPNGAIAIQIVSKREVTANVEQRFHLPDAPPADITIPTTRYRTAREWPANLRGGDHLELQPQHAHWPLIFMLLLTQSSVGLFGVDLVLHLLAPDTLSPVSKLWLPAFALVFGLAGLAVSVLHLGRPLQAWRSFLGLRRSWLSREVVVFGAFPLFAVPCTFFAATGQPSLPLSAATALSGIIGVFCSVMLYVDTRRDFWSFSSAFGKFFGTVALLGSALLLAAAPWLALSSAVIQPMLAVLVVTAVFKLALDLRFLRDHETAYDDVNLTPLQCSARLLTQGLGVPMRARIALLVFGGILLPLLFVAHGGGTGLLVTIGLLCAGSEFLERYLFFTAVAPPRMPGGV